ncbi:MAG: hypothetical protein OEV49_12895 [candidate division Zixibacteria bacterium]|nr:hypothetical protein [candidate division Zixibacteria bacterium]MDH3937898.1 hypothetical protein [candidate division Zixibacteria bacterium]MDH4034062.1 hypothetical protein [candidate division Zixibacteria bacterium]
MRDCKLYMTILAFSVLLGLAVFAVTPDQAVSNECGGFPCRAYYCCQDQGQCSAGYLEYGICLVAPPSCSEVCDFDFMGCWFPEEC